jgi:hypothetical protein
VENHQQLLSTSALASLWKLECIYEILSNFREAHFYCKLQCLENSSLACPKGKFMFYNEHFLLASGKKKKKKVNPKDLNSEHRTFAILMHVISLVFLMEKKFMIPTC